jgi:uncharacterized protein YqgC (DUF456 family)
VDLLVALATLLLVAAVVGCFVPGVPAGALTVGGVALYWWHVGAGADVLALAGLAALGIFALVADFLAGAVAGRAGGASWGTMALAGGVGFVLLFVLGPLGVLLGVAGTVFLVEYRRHGDVEAGARAAVYAAVGVLGSALVQALLTGLALVGFLVVAFY